MNEIFLGDAFNTLRALENDAIDCILIDPPYNILRDHKIETEIDIERLFIEFDRVSYEDSFLCFFGVMPTILDWHKEAIKYFDFKQDIIWVKRSHSSPLQNIHRKKELIYIYSKGKAKYNNVKDRVEDIVIPTFYNNLLNIKTLYRYFSEIRRGGRRTGIKKQTKQTCNDDYYLKKYQHARRSHNLEEINISDVWSFLPENKKNLNQSGVKHPTVKPVKLIERLIKLLTTEGDVILDCFLGSGTTAVASKRLKRNFIGSEIDKEYFDIAKNRLENETKTIEIFENIC